MIISPKVVVVDDDTRLAEFLARTLVGEGCDSIVFGSAEEALDYLETVEVDVILADQRMEHMCGTAFLEIVKEKQPKAVRVLMTGYDDEEALKVAINSCDVYRYISKPFEPEELKSVVQQAVELRQLEETNKKLHLELMEKNTELEHRVEKRTRQLSQAETRLRALLESSPAAVLTVDAEGHISSMTNAAAELFGYKLDDIIGEPCSVLFDPLDLDRGFITLMKRVGLWRDDESCALHIESKLRRADGRTFDADVALTWIETQDSDEYGLFIRDLTGVKQAEAEHRHAQKLEAVGRLASGIAHEINTPIQFIGDNVSFLKDAFDSLFAVVKSLEMPELKEVFEEADLGYFSEEVPSALEQTREGVARITEIVQAMKEFAHPDQAEKTAVDINRALKNTITVARNEIKYVADVETDFEEELPPVAGHGGDLNQVFLNLLINAGHAIEEVVGSSGTKGVIRIATRSQNESVHIEIGDTGAGIPEAVRQNIFDPFFTTKGIGRGTGQGLAIARSILVEKHGGSIWFDTETGKGTTFHIELPRDSLD